MENTAPQTDTTDHVLDHWATNKDSDGVSWAMHEFLGSWEKSCSDSGGEVEQDLAVIESAQNGCESSMHDVLSWAVDTQEQDQIEDASWVSTIQFGEVFTIGSKWSIETHRGVEATPTSKGLYLVDDGSSEQFAVDQDEWKSWIEHDFTDEDQDDELNPERYWDEWAQCGQKVEYSDRYEVYRVAD